MGTNLAKNQTIFVTLKLLGQSSCIKKVETNIPQCWNFHFHPNLGTGVSRTSSEQTHTIFFNTPSLQTIFACFQAMCQFLHAKRVRANNCNWGLFCSELNTHLAFKIPGLENFSGLQTMALSFNTPYFREIPNSGVRTFTKHTNIHLAHQTS